MTRLGSENRRAAAGGRMEKNGVLNCDHIEWTCVHSPMMMFNITSNDSLSGGSPLSLRPQFSSTDDGRSPPS